MDKKLYVHVQLSEELKKQLEQEAKESELSLNAYIRTILIKRNK